MTPAPNPAVTVIFIGPNGEVRIATNVGDHRLLVTTSQREFEQHLDFGFPFHPSPVLTVEALRE